MGQWWILVDLDKSQAKNLWKLGPALRNLPLHEWLTRSYSFRSSSEICGGSETTHQQLQSPLLRRVPPEIILYILDHCDDFQTSLCLTLTCRMCYDVSRAHVEHQLNQISSWTGDRIAMFGDSICDFNDLPNSKIFTPDERELIKVYVERELEYDDRSAPDSNSEESDESRAVGFWAGFLDERCSEPVDVKQYGDAISDDPSSPDVSLFHRAVCEKSFSDSVPVANQVLRNLTEKVYIRGDAFARESLDRTWGLGNVLVFRICWSPDPSVAFVYDGHGDIVRGPWTGHRFDIVDRTTLPTTEDGTILPGWTDMTDELIEDTIYLFEREFAPMPFYALRQAMVVSMFGE